MRTEIDSRQPRIPLTRERVLNAAIVLADTGGIDSLSMRRLAQDLGVKAMSLYNHVADKDDILDGIVDLVFAEIARRRISARQSPSGEGSSISLNTRSTMPSRISSLLATWW